MSETERGEVRGPLTRRGGGHAALYLCSGTMYRVLASEVPVQERRAQRTHPEYKKPELMATAAEPGVVLGFTRLLGPKKWSYYYLYASRYVVGWMVADREKADPAELPEAWRPAPGPDPALGSGS